MSLIYGLIARLAWPSIMAASRGKVATLDVRRPGHFAWGPLLVSAGAPEGTGFVLRRILRLKSARDVFPNLSIERGASCPYLRMGLCEFGRMSLGPQ